MQMEGFKVGCCVLAVMIVGQILEFWRRTRQFFGMPAELYPDPYMAAPEPVPGYAERLRQLLRKPAARVALALALVAEGTMAAAWLVTEHQDHIQSGAASLMQLAAGAGQQVADICRASSANTETETVGSAP